MLKMFFGGLTKQKRDNKNRTDGEESCLVFNMTLSIGVKAKKKLSLYYTLF